MLFSSHSWSCKLPCLQCVQPINLELYHSTQGIPICRIVTGVVLGGSSRFHSKATTVKHIVIDTANNASNTIYSTTAALRGVEASARPFVDTGRGLNSIANRLDQQANKIQSDARRNRRWVVKGLTAMQVSCSQASCIWEIFTNWLQLILWFCSYAVTAVLISLNLVSVLALLGKQLKHVFILNSIH